MDRLEIEGLEITVAEENPTVITWRGVSQIKSPGSFIDPFFNNLIGKLEAKQVIVDCTELEYINSSTMLPIIHLCNILNKKNIQTVVRYDKESDWQSVMFKGLIALSRVLKCLNVEPA